MLGLFCCRSSACPACVRAIEHNRHLLCPRQEQELAHHLLGIFPAIFAGQGDNPASRGVHDSRLFGQFGGVGERSAAREGGT
jgi:predicted amidophosphoribosyltransferase